MIITPQVSVLIPMYNAEKYIAQTIESVLSQTFSDFELIILNDCSTDNSKNIALSFNDKRIRYFENESNLGLPKTRNKLIELSKGDLLAWLDADDLYHNEFLEYQIKNLSNKTNICLSASWAKIINSNGQETGEYLKSYFENKYLPPLFLFVNYIVQSSVVMRKKMFNNAPFNINYPPSLDYDLWSRTSLKYPLEILPKVLVNYRVHEKSMSITQADIMKRTVKSIHQNLLENIGIKPTDEELELHYNISFLNSHQISVDFLNKALSWLKNIESKNITTKIYHTNLLNYVICHRFTKICTSNKNLGMQALKIYFNSNYFKFTFQNIFNITKYLFSIL